MKRRSVIASMIGAGAWLGACTAGTADPADGHGTLARWPILPVIDLKHQQTTLPATSGGPRIFNVWALWCPPCRREMPGLQRLANSLATRGVDLCALALADDSFAVREYLAQHAPQLRGALLSPRAPAAQQLGLKVLPQTFIVAADGRVLARWVGEREWDSPAVRQALNTLLRSG